VPTRQCLGDAKHQRPLSVKELAFKLDRSPWQSLEWREGTNFALRSRFARIRVQAAHRDDQRSQLRPQERLLVEWPEGHREPMKYWLCTLPEDVPLLPMMLEAKMRWRIERDYQDLKQELGLGHFEGRSWRGFHHHASLGIAAFGFLMVQQLRHPDRAGKSTLHDAKNLPCPRTTSLAAAPRTQRRIPSSITSLRLSIAAALFKTLPRCLCCLRANARLRLRHSKTRRRSGCLG
jgi:SRSO17 transposase